MSEHTHETNQDGEMSAIEIARSAVSTGERATEHHRAPTDEYTGPRRVQTPLSALGD